MAGLEILHQIAGPSRESAVSGLPECWFINSLLCTSFSHPLRMESINQLKGPRIFGNAPPAMRFATTFEG